MIRPWAGMRLACLGSTTLSFEISPRSFVMSPRCSQIVPRQSCSTPWPRLLAIRPRAALGRVLVLVPDLYAFACAPRPLPELAAARALAVVQPPWCSHRGAMLLDMCAGSRHRALSSMVCWKRWSRSFCKRPSRQRWRRLHVKCL